MGKSIEQIRQEVWGCFQPSQCVYLGTTEVDQPRVRPVTLLNLDEKFWIATGTRSGKARQMRRNPNVEFCLPLTAECGQGYVRVSGVASPVTGPETRDRIAEQIPFLHDFWSGSDDPDFALFRITRVEVEYLAPGETEAHTFIV
jgi:uncharacterized pyridoxamine 5'-phosphate oxidase family protein